MKNEEYFRVRTLDSVFCDSQGEYTLPDYNTDVKKILFTKATPTLSGKFHDGDNLEYVGSLNYDIIYLDGENNITHTNFNTDYDLTVKCSGETYVDSMIRTKVNGVNLRLLGPRKFSCKSNLESSIYISESENYCPNMDNEREDLEVLTSHVTFPKLEHFTGDEQTLSDRVETLEGVLEDEVEILLTSPQINVTSTVKDGDRVKLKGVCTVSVLRKINDEMPNLCEKEIAFEDEIEVGEELSELDFSAKVNCNSVKCEVKAEEDGVALVTELNLQSEIHTFLPQSIDLITDCYYTDSGCDNIYTDFSYTELVDIKTYNEKLSNIRKSDTGATLRSEVGCDNLRNVLYSTSEIRVDNINRNGETLKISGVVRFSGVGCELAESEAENPVTYCNIKFDIPFEKTVKLDTGIGEDVKFKLLADCDNSEITLDERSIYPECNIKMTLFILSDKKVKCIEQSDITEEVFAKDSSIIRVYFPEKSDTLFSVGKKFHRSMMQIASDNSLTEEVFSNSDSGLKSVKKLIIK